MYFKEYFPDKKLWPFIRSYFHIQVKPGTEFSFPSDGCPGLIVNLGEPFLLGSDKNDLVFFSGCRIFGYLSRRLIIKALNGADALAVKFRPGQLTPFIRLPGIELTDTSVSINNAWGPQGKTLADRIYDSNSILEIVQFLDGFFLKCLALYEPTDRRIVGALNEIIKQKGQVGINNLSRRTNLSRRQFERRFKKTIGLTPKRMCRIARIAGLIPHLKTGKKIDWTEIALNAGFSDQAHFIREWKYFTDSSPLSYLKDLIPVESAIVGL